MSNPFNIIKIVVVTMPLNDIRDRHALQNYVLKRVLHKPYALTAEEMKQSRCNSPVVRQSSNSSSITYDKKETSLLSFHETTSSSNTYVVVHINSMEVHTDTVCQINARGDVRFNVTLSLVVAQLQHGMLAGVAENSPYSGCMQVHMRESTAHSLNDYQVAQNSVHGFDAKLNESKRSGKISHNNNDFDTANRHNHNKHESQDDSTVRLTITARCTEDEPVVAGQAVLVVSEPGVSLRCLAFRAPRCAPGPFQFAQVASTVDSNTQGIEIVCDSAIASTNSKVHSKMN